MVTLQEAEVQFAQRLASNEKLVRSKAIKKLRKYITVRSQRDTDGFSGDELLKLWKGLFYCLWMQDKMLLQEELSNMISSLIHNFHNLDGQFLYLASFLQTVKREWTGIDRLRMDKFFQLVRFMFRQSFELLKRKNWEESVVGRFLELLTAQLLQSNSEAPIGLQLHILDLYLAELAALGSAELTADQNLKFIEPFCKTAARTKDRTLFRGICSGIFSTIIDQAPYAIEDLMKELKATEASDSGQASEEEEEEEERQVKPKTKSKPVGKKDSGKQINGHKSCESDDDDDDDDDVDSDDLLHLDSDSDQPCENDVGPVLQFDYSALAEQLLALSSRGNTPSYNRQRLYKIIKVLQDLSEGIFPQDEYPDEVSTDEDDDMFGSRKRMKRGGGHTKEEEEEGTPAAKKRKGKKKETSSFKQSKTSGKDDSEAADVTSNDQEKKKKKKKKRKKKKTAGQEQAAPTETEAADLEKEAQTPATAAPETNSQSDAVQVAEQPAGTVTDDQSEAQDQQETGATVGTTETLNDDDAAAAAASGKKKKKKNKKAEEELKTELSADKTEAESQAKTEEATPKTESESQVKTEEATPKTESESESQENTEEEVAPETEAPPTTNRKNDVRAAADEASGDSATDSSKNKKKKKKNTQELQTHQEEAVITPEESTLESAAATPLKKKRKKHLNESNIAALDEEKVETSQEADDGEAILPEVTATTPAKKKKKKNPEAAAVEAGVDGVPPAEEPEALSSEKPTKKRKKKVIPVTFEYEADEVEAAATVNGLTEDAAAEDETASAALGSNKKKKKAKSSSGSDFVSFQSEATTPTPLFCRTKGRCSAVTPKNQTPKSESKKVTFGLKNNKTAEFKKTDRSLLLSPDGSSRVPFDPQQKPKCGVLKSTFTLRSASAKKTPNRKKAVTSPKSTPRRRPSAADFF